MWKAPDFWWQRERSLLARLLRPLAWLYSKAQILHRRLSLQKPVRAPFPVVSVGSLVMGGSGKTPVTLSLGRLLQRGGWKPVVVTRGFGGKAKGPLWVDPACHHYTEVGDEALLLAKWFPTLVAKRRADALSLLASGERTIILLDDGHQHNSLFKDISFLVVDAQQEHGNASVFPAGPLREPLSEGVERADALIWIGEKAPPLFSKPVFTGYTHTRCTLKEGARVVGFAGLGYPLKFKKTLEKLRLKICKFIAFPDHFPYHVSDLHTLEQTAQQHQAILVTTEKDFYRLPSSFREKVVRVKMDIVWDDLQCMEAFLREHL